MDNIELKASNKEGVVWYVKSFSEWYWGASIVDTWLKYPDSKQNNYV